MSHALNTNSSEVSKFYACAKGVITKEKIVIPSALKYKIQNVVVKKLGLQNINQLRDRFEGQKFMDQVMLLMTGIYVLEKSLNADIIIQKGFPFGRENQNIITIGNKSYHLIVSYFGYLPSIVIQPKLPLVFCGIRTDFKNGIFYGFLNTFDLNDQEIFTKKNIGLFNSYEFFGFDSLMHNQI